MANAAVIQKLNSSLDTVNSSLSQANSEIQKLQANIVAMQKANEITFEPYNPKKNDEIDQKLGEFLNKNKIPTKFIRIGDGCYCFGSKMITVKIHNNKLVVRIGGGFMMLEDFIKLYAVQELMKLRLMKGVPMQYTELELEDIPPEIRSQIINEEEREQTVIKEMEMNKSNDWKMISNINASSTNSLHTSRVSPKSKFPPRSAVEKNLSSSRLEEKAITPRKSENNAGNIFKLHHNLEQEAHKSEAYEVTPLESTRKKNRVVRDVIERNKSNIAQEQHSLVTSNYNSKYDKDTSPWKKSVPVRKDISPIGKKINENHYSKKSLI